MTYVATTRRPYWQPPSRQQRFAVMAPWWLHFDGTVLWSGVMTYMARGAHHTRRPHEQAVCRHGTGSGLRATKRSAEEDGEEDGRDGTAGKKDEWGREKVPQT